MLIYTNNKIAFKGITEVGAAAGSVAKNNETSICNYKLSFIVDDSGKYKDYSKLKEIGFFDEFSSRDAFSPEHVVLETKFKRVSNLDLNPEFKINGKTIKFENIAAFRQMMNILSRELLNSETHPACTKKFMMNKEVISNLFTGIYSNLPRSGIRI